MIQEDQVEAVARALHAHAHGVARQATRGCAIDASFDKEREYFTEAANAALSTVQPKDEIRREVIEECAAYIEGKGGVIPGTVVFAPLVSGNNQPCMSGDPRDRLPPPRRREFDNATHSLAQAIRDLIGRGG